MDRRLLRDGLIVKARPLGGTDPVSDLVVFPPAPDVGTMTGPLAIVKGAAATRYSVNGLAVDPDSITLAGGSRPVV